MEFRACVARNRQAVVDAARALFGEYGVRRSLRRSASGEDRVIAAFTPFRVVTNG